MGRHPPPGLVETAGEYDGQFLFINDKANARVAVIDLRDFETKQIVKNPTAINDHGGIVRDAQHRVRDRRAAVRHPHRLGVRPAGASTRRSTAA